MSFRPSEEEEKYFQAENAARRATLRDKLNDAARDVAERAAIGKSMGTESDEIVNRIRELGFDGDTARVFDLLPLIHVAWADGKVSGRERVRIMKLVEHRGLAPDSEAWQLAAALLEERPTDAFLDQTLAVLRDLVASKGAGASGSFVDLCLEIAGASGGFLGLTGGISAEERATLEHIAGMLGDDAQLDLQKKLAR
jgi:uncharacterized tellurite resistance protein B-like protein